MQQIYRRSPMPKCDETLLKSHFGMGLVNFLNIFRTLFIRTPLEDCFCYYHCDWRSTEALKQTHHILILKEVILSGFRSYEVKRY